jgi:hypothetical protein
MLANGKLFRQIESRSTNPKYTFTNKTDAFSLGEVSAPIIVFGDMESGTVSRGFVEYFFGKQIELSSSRLNPTHNMCD